MQKLAPRTGFARDRGLALTSSDRHIKCRRWRVRRCVQPRDRFAVLSDGALQTPNGRFNRLCTTCRALADSNDSTFLRSLEIRGFALVGFQRVEFSPGLNVISGESGSGKSVLLSAFNMILGAQASGDLIRPPADTAGWRPFLAPCT
jgi:AAA domain